MTSVQEVRRDYSLTGSETPIAIASGLADGQWWQADISPDRLKELSARSNGRAAFDMTLWIALIVGSGLLAWNVRDSWWAIPAFALYGALYGGSADARWHECGHGTAFRTTWLNDLFYYPACFMLARQPLFWRWSHFRHHTDTIVRGRDAEIVFQRPASIPQTLFAFTHLKGGPQMMWGVAKTAGGQLTDVDRDLIPEEDLKRLVTHAGYSLESGWPSSSLRLRPGHFGPFSSSADRQSMEHGWCCSSGSPSTVACRRMCSITATALGRF